MEIYLILFVLLTNLVAPTSGAPVCRGHPAEKPRHFYLSVGDTVQLTRGGYLTTAGKWCITIPPFAKTSPVGNWTLAPQVQDVGVYRVGYQLPHHQNPSIIFINIVSGASVTSANDSASEARAPIWEDIHKAEEVDLKNKEEEFNKVTALEKQFLTNTRTPLMTPMGTTATSITTSSYTTNAPAFPTSFDEPAPKTSSTASTKAPTKKLGNAISSTTIPSVVFCGGVVVVMVLVILLIVFILRILRVKAR